MNRDVVETNQGEVPNARRLAYAPITKEEKGYLNRSPYIPRPTMHIVTSLYLMNASLMIMPNGFSLDHKNFDKDNARALALSTPLIKQSTTQSPQPSSYTPASPRPQAPCPPPQ